MFCTSCGKIINDDSEYCSYCGSKVVPVKPASPVADATIQSEQAQIMPEQSPQIMPEQSLTAENTENTEEGPSFSPIDNRTGYAQYYNEPRERHRASRIHRHFGRPVSGMTKFVLALLVVWSAIIGIIMVRHTLKVQNAREAARTTAGTAVSSETFGGGTVSGDSQSTPTQGETGASGAGVTTEPEPVNLTFTCLFKNATGWDQINQVTAYLSPGKDAPSTDPTYLLEMAQDGRVVSAATAGEYTLSWHAEGYYDGYENVTIGQSQLAMEKNLIPVLTDPKNCSIMLEWNGDRDLDLALFDAHTGQYINILFPVENGNFLFEDTVGNRRCEVIRIADCTQSQVYTVYVRDDNLLRNIASESIISMMERDGVSITVATAAGIVAYKKAVPDSTSALWSPLYVYEGNVYPLDNYITDYSQEAWAFYDKTVK